MQRARSGKNEQDHFVFYNEVVQDVHHFFFNEGVQVPIVSEDVNNTICSQFLETSFEAKLEGFDVVPKDCSMNTSVCLMLLVYNAKQAGSAPRVYDSL